MYYNRIYTMLYQAIIWVGTFVLFISFLFALIINNRYGSKIYMKGFYLYPLLGLCLSANTILSTIFFIYNPIDYFLLQFLLLLFDLIFWIIFFLTIFKDDDASIKIKYIFSITLLISLVSFLFNNLDKPNLHTVSIFNICKVFFCIIYYNKLFNDKPIQNIKTEPLFWIVTGLFFYASLSIPFYTLNFYIRSQFSLIIASNIFSISNVLIIIMHLFFLKAYLCIVRQYRVL